MIESTYDLKHMPHIVVLKTATGAQVFEYNGPGCMERAHEFAQKLVTERSDAVVLVAMRYRQLGSPQAWHLTSG